MENHTKYPYSDESLSFEERAKDLVSRMTIEEKALQTVYTAAAIERLGVQRYNWWNEALHGVARAGTATVFPQAIALAATFDENIVHEVATAVSDEGRAKYNMQQMYQDYGIYKGLTFWSPNINIFRDPRWGRGHETYGEDPYLTSRLGVSFVKGLQGNDKKYLKAAACAKHFAVHSGPEGGRHSFNAVVSKKDMYETYLSAFKACVTEAGVESVMGAYNRTNDEPCCGSKTLLEDILRGEWGFKGHVVSDCGAVNDFHAHHHITANAVESAAMAINNGCDLNCGNVYLKLMAAYNDGLITEETIDNAVTRLMITRMKLGMFDKKENVPYNNIDYSVVDSQEHKNLNFKAAVNSVVMLKNENNILPLDLNKIKTIGVIGPNANSRAALVGNYEGTASRYITMLEGIQDYVNEKNKDTRIYYSEGCHLYSSAEDRNNRFSEARAVAEKSDVVILCLGLDASLEGEEGDANNEFASGDKITLKFPGKQEELAKTIISIGKPVILLSITGSAIAFGESNKADAVLQVFYPGAAGGKAVASILFGDNSPAGKLPITFYKTTEELPDFTNYDMKNRTYRYMENEPLYPFGYGLSYAAFEFSEFSSDTVKDNSSIAFKCSLKIKNTGNIPGAETIQVYVKAHIKDAPKYQLKKIKKVTLLPNEEKKAEFELCTEDFSLYNDDGKLVLNDCKYTVYVSNCQPNSFAETVFSVDIP